MKSKFLAILSALLLVSVSSFAGNITDRLEAKGGKFGEYIELLEQGLASAGEAFGEWLADELD